MTLHSRDLLTEMQTILDDLDYDFSRLTVEHFVTWLEGKKRRVITLVPWSVPSAISGAWISTSDYHDYIFYDEDASPMLQQHIQLNHLARILLDHKTLQVDSENDIDSSNLGKIAFRGQMNQLSQQTLLDMVRYVLCAKGSVW